MSKFFVLLIMMVATVVAQYQSGSSNPAADQLPTFKESLPGPVGLLTTLSGAPVCYEEATETLNKNLNNNAHYQERITHFVRERIPERVVHAKGTGAFGHFVATKDVSKYCRADFLRKGKKTPIAVRFSASTGERGSSDLNLDSRGMAIKFYTEHGNFDLVTFNTPMYVYNNPHQFRDLTHAFKRNPATGLFDFSTIWDAFINFPHAISMFLLVYSGRGVPMSYGYMPGFSLHTYQVHNEHGERWFWRFHIMPDAGIKNFDTDTAANISITDSDYLTRELYNKIAKGDSPKWTVYAQILSEADVKKLGSHVWDATRTICLKKYPLHELGKFLLDRNPKNHFAEIEQLAFCPANLVDGIDGGPEKLFESRELAYRDAHMFRLGVNVNKIPVNRPYRVKTYTYNRDGAPSVDDNEGGAPNYYPNSFHGPLPYKACRKMPGLIQITEKNAYNFDQASELYENELTPKERDQLIKNIYTSLCKADPSLHIRAVKTLGAINVNLGYRVARGLNDTCY